MSRARRFTGRRLSLWQCSEHKKLDTSIRFSPAPDTNVLSKINIPNDWVYRLQVVIFVK